jgi:hypothetical protein
MLNFQANMNTIRHRRLRNQHLLKTNHKDPVEVLKSLVAVQAQDFYGAKWALGQRTENCSDEKVEQAFAAGRILRLHVLRPTWHFVAPDDIRWLVQLTAPRINTFSSHYYRKAGLDEKVFRRTNEVLIKALQGGRQLTRSELREAVARAGIEPGDSMRFGYIMHRSELDGLVCSGARKGNQFTYALVAERAPRARTLERDEALGELTLRYFKSRGPATVHDYVWWSGLTIAEAKRGIEINGNRVKSQLIENKTYWASMPSRPAKASATRRVHLLPAYDEYFIAYKDRSAGMHSEFSQKDTASRLVFDAPMVVDGQVVGGWKRLLGQNSVTIEFKPFLRLTRADRSAFSLAAKSYGEFLGKDARVEFL